MKIVMKMILMHVHNYLVSGIMGYREVCVFVLVLVCAIVVHSKEHHHHKGNLKILHKMTPQNGCSGSDTPLCCNVKNNTCRVFGQRMNNANSSTCFCDSACGVLGDCCLDYLDSCKRKLLLRLIACACPVFCACL
jgi:hypothetical protein